MKNTYIGLFFTSLAALMLEILLTRVFSVATWYYFAFFAISVAMFGFTVGALGVYIWKDWFSDDALYKRLTLFGILFGITVDVAIMLFLSIPFYPRLTGVGIFSTVFIYMIISAPFVCAGVIVCLCLTRFPKVTSLMYAADLIGAAIGAFLVFPVLNAMDAPTSILLVGAAGAFGALFFAKGMDSTAIGGKLLASWSKAAFLALSAIMLVNYAFTPVRVEWVKTVYNIPQTEAWNAFSRIAVYPMRIVRLPYSWGLSRTYKPTVPIFERMIDIDGVSETVMTYYDGNPKTIDHLKYDVTAIAHYLRDDAKVFIIGVGGGRDILAAKAFNQKEIVGAEINNRTLEMVNYSFADFTGHLDKLPNVRIINDEARSAITRMDEKFDIIQASCIATWSATTAGAFSLAENTLYTVEAWNVFLDHLTPNGIMSFNRWYSPDYPAQLMRMASLASYTLRARGVTDPGRHIAIVRSEMINKMPSATIIISKSPFTPEDLKKLHAAVDYLQFKFEFDPSGRQNPMFRTVIDNASDPVFHKSTRLDLTPSVDDRPFFFYMLRGADIFAGKSLQFDEQRFSMEGILMLFILMVVSIALCIVFIFAPLLLMRKRAPLPAGAGAVGLLFFASIGLGYILVEIGQLQRLIVFLGHPIYSITVVIFSMLLFSGLGALTSSRWTRGNTLKGGHIIAFTAVILALLVFYTFAQSGILSSFERQTTVIRIIIALLFLMPLGYFMGFLFPFGMHIASQSFREHTPWFWAVNGATGVVSSVLSVWISISYGFTATLLAGLACYVSAAVCLWFFYSMKRPVIED